MAEDILPFFDREIKDQMQGIIKVVGVGGVVADVTPCATCIWTRWVV